MGNILSNPMKSRDFLQLWIYAEFEDRLLQIPVRRFDSGPGLHHPWRARSAASSARLDREARFAARSSSCPASGRNLPPPARAQCALTGEAAGCALAGDGCRE